MSQYVYTHGRVPTRTRHSGQGEEGEGTGDEAADHPTTCYVYWWNHLRPNCVPHIDYMHRRIATSTLEDGRMLLVEAVEPSRTLNIDPGFTLQLMAAYADEHTKPWRQKRKRNLIADLVKYSYISDTGSHTWLYLNVISQLVLQLSPNHVVQKTLGLALEKYGRGRQHRQLGFMTDLGPRNVYYKGYNSLAEFLTGIPMVGENGTWQQLLALVPYENPVVPVTPWMSR